MTDINGAVEPGAKFEFFSGMLKAAGGGGEPMTLSGTASSTVEDLHGDNIQRTGLKDMARQIEGMTIFRNHSYSVPDDVMGTATGGRIIKRGEDADGNAVWDFDIDMKVNEANPLAVKAWEYIKNGTKLGFSIGANIPPGGVEVDRKTGAKTISHVNLLETSIVGIPANPRSWIARALDAIGEFKNDASSWTLSPNRDYIEPAALLSADEIKAAPPADDREEDELEASGCPECGGDHDVEACNTPKTSRRRKEAEESAPSDAVSEADTITEADESASVEGATPLESQADDAMAAIESLDEDALTQFAGSVELLAKVVGDLKVAKVERDEALQAKEAAERERDEAVAKASEAIVKVGDVVRTLKKTPLGRKTALQQSEKDLAVVERFYGPEMRKMMENTHRE